MGAGNSIEEGKTNKVKQKEEEKYATFLIQIKILMNSVLIWEKTYNIEETFQTIYNDFINEKKYEKGYSIKWYYNKINIDFNSTKLKQFLKENNLLDISTLEINQKIIFDENENEKIVEYSDYFGIPYFNPFSLLIYNKKQNTLKAKKFKDNKILNGEVKFGRECAYCNGKNHFYIFGGILDSTEEELGIFLDFDLKKETLKNQININPPKRNHSMMYSEKKIYMVGGNDEKTLFYDSKEKTLQNFGKLNKKRFEPSLIRHYNYLYCFDASKKNGEKFSFEKFNLNNISGSSWEIIYPNISPKLSNNVYNQKFFGITDDNKHNLIFLGGLYDNNSAENSEPNSTIFNLKYNLLLNTMEISDIPFKEVNLVEKTFLPLDEDTSFLLVKSQRRIIKKIEFHKKNNKMEISDLKQEVVKIKEKKNKYQTQINLKNSLIGINFDMPNPNATSIGKIPLMNDNDTKLINSKNVIFEGINGNTQNPENIENNVIKDKSRINGDNITNENNKSNIIDETNSIINNNINLINDNNVNIQPNENTKINGDIIVNENPENNTNTKINYDTKGINIDFKDNNNIDDNLLKNEEIKDTEKKISENMNINNNNIEDIKNKSEIKNELTIGEIKKEENKASKDEEKNTINEMKKNDDIKKEEKTNIVETPINNEDNNRNKNQIETPINKDNVDDKKDINNKLTESQKKENKIEDKKENIIYNINSDFDDSIDINYRNQKELNKIAKSNAGKSASRKVIKKEGLKIMKKNINYLIENNY